MRRVEYILGGLNTDIMCSHQNNENGRKPRRNENGTHYPVRVTATCGSDATKDQLK